MKRIKIKKLLFSSTQRTFKAFLHPFLAHSAHFSTLSTYLFVLEQKRGAGDTKKIGELKIMGI